MQVFDAAEEFPARPEFYTVPEFLRTYKISRTEFYRQVSAGRIFLTKLGTASRVNRKHAEEWAAALPVRKGAAA